MYTDNLDVFTESKESLYASLQQNIIEKFKEEFDNNIYNIWLKNIFFKKISEFEIVLTCPNTFIRDWIKKEYFKGSCKIVNGQKKWLKKGIVDIILEICPKVYSIDLLVDKKIEFKKQELDINNNGLQEIDKIASYSENDNLYNIGIELNKNYIFDNFIIGNSNKIAYETIKTVAQTQSSELNPVFLYGSVGVGKTHLCQAAAWEMKRNFPNKKIIYLTAEKFMYLFIQSLQNQTINTFKNKFRSIDCLIIDDIQFIVGKETTQKEFFYTFETLVNENKQVILACDRSPINLNNIDEKLKSRLNGGLIIDIKDNDFELRKQIIKQKSKLFNLILNNSLIDYLTENLAVNTREIEGCLKRLQLNQQILNITIDKDIVDSVLTDNLIQAQKIITIDKIQENVSKYFNISLAELKGNKRLKELVFARHIAMFLCKELTGKSFVDIAKKFNNKNHATVMYAVKKIEKELINNFELNKIISELRIN